MQEWYQCWPGSLYVQAEQQQINLVLSHLLGEYLLQMGGPPSFSQSSPIRHKFYLQKSNPHHTDMFLSKRLNIQASPEELPIHPNHINVIIAAHILELTQQPQLIIQEIAQALAPQGQLILLGINPFSLLGWIHSRKGHHLLPQQERFWPAWQVKNWLLAAGFNIISCETFNFRPPLHQPWEQRLCWLEPAGQLCFPGMGGIFLINAQKREIGMKPIKLHWWSNPQRVVINNGYIKPTSQVKHYEQSN